MHNFLSARWHYHIETHWCSGGVAAPLSSLKDPDITGFLEISAYIPMANKHDFSHKYTSLLQYKNIHSLCLYNSITMDVFQYVILILLSLTR